MTKIQFLNSLKRRLSVLPKIDVEERVSFYSEMIDDKIEEGLSEEAAIASIGALDKIVDEIIADIPFVDLIKKKIKPERRLSALEITLIILGSPIWISLFAVVFSLFVTVYAVIWSLVAVAFAVFASLVACSLAGVVMGIVFLCDGYFISAFALVSLGILCSGLSIFTFYGSFKLTKATVLLSLKFIRFIKGLFIKGDN